MTHRAWRSAAPWLLLGLTACGGAPQPPGPEATAAGPAAQPLRNAYFGDLHIHTGFSLDAFQMNLRGTPDDAYRYARGEPLRHPAGYPIRLRGEPLDFLAVADHAEYLGVFNTLTDPEHALFQSELVQELKERRATFSQRFSESWAEGRRLPSLWHPDVMRDTWQREVAAAERHYRPGEFTTFVGYEYTSFPGYNLHRNVIFRSADVPELPFGGLDSQNPEDLWSWLDEQRAQGIEAIAIPHNSNWSAGRFFQRTKTAGDPIDAAYAEQRMRNEPLVEVTQIKGTSETHPALSPNDEWAGFEIRSFDYAPEVTDVTPAGSYVRDAYRTGLELEEDQGFNPYRFGLIGSSDSHNVGAPYEESSYYGGHGTSDATPEQRGSVPPRGARTWPAEGAPARSLRSSGGFAAVWAEANTREAIFDAFRRKETFATTGPRIRVRFFGGFEYPDSLADDVNAVGEAYAGGVPMGGDLLGGAGKEPRFLVWALRDPTSGWLERLQIVKGWIEDGQAQERVYDVACSDGLEVDPSTHRCPDNGAEVNLSDCSVSAGVGATQLRTLWTDPDFDSGQRAFYYVRALENPSCRWSTWDAVRAGVPPSPSFAVTIQERAWSSPIWYVP